jgi:hypothetical protein
MDSASVFGDILPPGSHTMSKSFLHLGWSYHPFLAEMSKAEMRGLEQGGWQPATETSPRGFPKTLLPGDPAYPRLVSEQLEPRMHSGRKALLPKAFPVTVTEVCPGFSSASRE